MFRGCIVPSVSNWRMSFGITFLLCIGTGVFGCQSVQTPPTFVLAYIDDNADLRAVERDTPVPGSWTNPVGASANSSSPHLGPAIVHDSEQTWMLMWVDGPELQYKVGLTGGRPGRTILWENAPNVGVLPVFPAGSPALAYGDRRWVAAYRNAGGGLSIVRSQPDSDTSWETPVPVAWGGTAAPVLASTAKDPALTFGIIGNCPLFVLMYVDVTLGAVSLTSVDGIHWTPPVAVGGSGKDPALTTGGGRVYALLSRQVGTLGTSYHGFLYSSCDGTTWFPIGTYPAASTNTTGAAMTFGEGRLLISEQIGGITGGNFYGISIRVGTPTAYAACPTANGFSISGDNQVDIGSATLTGPSVGSFGARTALAFGESTSTPDTFPLCAPISSNLLINEWFPDRVELYLDEPTSFSVDLSGMWLEVWARRGSTNGIYKVVVPLIGTMRGGEFLVIWEAYGYNGGAVREDYIDPGTGAQYPGIKVKFNLFGWYLGGMSTSLRIMGRSGGDPRIRYTIDDVLKVGTIPRPDTPRPDIAGGEFIDAASPLPLPHSSESLSRKWEGSGTPIDTDSENDWRVRPKSFGRRNQ